MTLSYHHPADVLRFAVDRQAGGTKTALIIACNVTGGAMRASGAMMCVDAGGDAAGYISNGCVDADIIFQAREAIKDDQPRFLRYGEGSPFKDIILPCGGRIDLWVRPDINAHVLNESAEALEARRAVALEISPDGQTNDYKPKLRLRIAGRGEAVAALASQAMSAGFEVVLQSPDTDLKPKGPLIRFDHLKDPATPPPCDDDAWTALVMMFHDHDWEPDLLKQALAGDAFYIGAMGSARTHAARKNRLAALGVSGADIARVRGPIGLIPSMRDANLLALSTLAEVVDAAQQAERL